MRGRRTFLRQAFASLAAAGPMLARTAPAASSLARDFDVFWLAIGSHYAYFGSGHDWGAARARWRPRALATDTREALLAALEGAMAELHDEHVTLDAHLPASPRDVPVATDVWAQWMGREAVISAVRAGSVADVAGAVPGMRVRTVQGVAVDRAVRGLLLRRHQGDPQARDWALRRLLAGPWAGLLAVEGFVDGRPRRLEIERDDTPAAGTQPLVARRIGERRNLGYLRLKNNLGETGLVQHFDAALLHLKDTRGLIIDLRETQSGGAPSVARALLGRFVSAESAWVLRVPHEAKARPAASPDLVTPRGPFAYAGRVVALVDRWTAGEGESLACGLEAAAQATLVGTGMAGLHGETREVRLPASGIGVRFPAVRVLHANGTPREAVRPAVPVDIVAPSGGPGDPILYQALKLLEADPALSAAPR